MDTKTKIIESQNKILDALSACETSIGLLYDKYAKRFFGTSTFWTALAEAERTHAHLLDTMHRFLDKGCLFYNLGKLNADEIKPIMTFIEESLKEADDKSLTLKNALSNALRIESSLLDAHFYDIVKSDASEFAIIAQRLSSETSKHLDSIRQVFNQENLR